MVVIYKDEYSVVSGDFICTMVTKRFSVRNRERFTDHLKLVGKLDKTGFYLDELINWIAGKIKVWQSVMGDSLNQDVEKKVGSNLVSVQHNKKKNNENASAEGSFDIFNSKSCPFCKSYAHFELLKCSEFKNLPMDTRMKFIVKNHVCWRCLTGHHLSYNCPINGILTCSKFRHNPLVCLCNKYGSLSNAVSSVASSRST